MAVVAVVKRSLRAACVVRCSSSTECHFLHVAAYVLIIVDTIFAK